MKRILQYLKGTASFGIVYSTKFSSHTIQGFCDANFGGGIDISLPVPCKLCVSTRGRFDILEQPKAKSVLLFLLEKPNIPQHVMPLKKLYGYEDYFFMLIYHRSRLLLFLGVTKPQSV